MSQYLFEPCGSTDHLDQAITFPQDVDIRKIFSFRNERSGGCSKTTFFPDIGDATNFNSGLERKPPRFLPTPRTTLVLHLWVPEKGYYSGEKLCSSSRGTQLVWRSREGRPPYGLCAPTTSGQLFPTVYCKCEVHTTTIGVGLSKNSDFWERQSTDPGTPRNAG